MIESVYIKWRQNACGINKVGIHNQGYIVLRLPPPRKVWGLRFVIDNKDLNFFRVSI